MAGLTRTWEGNVLNWLFRNQAVTQPTTIYVALYTAAPTDTTEGTEVSGGGYARQPVTFTAPAGDPRSVSNSANVDFPVATANWGTIVAAALHSASSGTGNMIAWASLVQSKTINTDDQLRFLAGDITVTLD